MLSDKKSLSLGDTVSFELRKHGTVLITSNGHRLACQNLDVDGGMPRQLKSAVWVKNSHPLFESDQATAWLLTLIQSKGSSGSDGNQFFIEMPPDEAYSNAHYRLVLNNATHLLEVVGPYSPLYDDECWTNRWSLIQSK